MSVVIEGFEDLNGMFDRSFRRAIIQRGSDF